MTIKIDANNSLVRQLPESYHFLRFTLFAGKHALMCRQEQDVSLSENQEVAEESDHDDQVADDEHNKDYTNITAEIIEGALGQIMLSPAFEKRIHEIVHAEILKLSGDGSE